MDWIERELAERAADGFFDDLPGSGRPIADLDTEYSATWWAARWVRRDAARQNANHLRRRLTADIAAALNLPKPAARERLQEIAAGVDELNRWLDTDQRLPHMDVDAVIIRGAMT